MNFILTENIIFISVINQLSNIYLIKIIQKVGGHVPPSPSGAHGQSLRVAEVCCGPI